MVGDVCGHSMLARTYRGLHLLWGHAGKSVAHLLHHAGVLAQHLQGLLHALRRHGRRL